ncbi:MAG TPA: hypothetical protein VHM19_23045 [Polyangiales bacterium]|nr:hypothetical protein [Polyangiales bacterium]
MTDRLHRIHAAPATGKGGCSVDIGGDRWRGDGSDNRDTKRLTARRIAVCWNVLEGWPTDALEAGCLREADEAAQALLDVLLSADLRGAFKSEPAIVEATRRLREAFIERDAKCDLTHGRKSDCACARKGGDAP